MLNLFLSHSKSIKNSIVLPFLNDLSLLNVPYWMDREQIFFGENIFNEIVKGINSSSHCIAFIDDSYLKGKWTIKELELFHDLEKETNTNIIFPIFCNISKEDVYNNVKWLKDRAFETIKNKKFGEGEREMIICRTINSLLKESCFTTDISVLEILLKKEALIPYNDYLRVIYESKYYISSDYKLTCIELCNLLVLLNIVNDVLAVPNSELKRIVFKLPTYVKRIALKNADYLNIDYITVLRRSICFITNDILQFLNS